MNLSQELREADSFCIGELAHASESPVQRVSLREATARKRYYPLSDAFIGEISHDIIKGKHKVICLNDDAGVVDIRPVKEKLINVFEQGFPERSSFEL